MANLINWSDRYNTGCDKIDKQHQHMVEIINRLFNAFEHAQAESIVPEIIKELEDYTHYHFSTEEELFEKYKYPLAQEHIDEHNSFKKKIVDFKEQLFSDNSALLPYDVMLFIKDWLIDHILNTDFKYREYLCKE